MIEPLEKLLGKIDESEWNDKRNKLIIQDIIHRLLDDVIEGGGNVFVTKLNDSLVPKDESEVETDGLKGYEKSGKE